MKINQIPYVIFQATSQFSFKFCITFQCHDTKFLWNFLAELLRFGQKEPIKVQILRLLCALMKVYPILLASFETTRSRFIQIFHHWSVSRRFFSSNLFTLHKKQFSGFWMVEWKFTKFFMLYLKLQISFSFHFLWLCRMFVNKLFTYLTWVHLKK